MKKIILSLIILMSTTTQSFAGFYDSGWFEPTMLCAVGAGVGISGTDGDGTRAATYCAGGAVLGLILNHYYRKKVDIVRENRLTELKGEVKRRVVRQAEKANMGVVDDFYALEAEQVEEAQEMPDGSVYSPTKKIILKKP